MLAQFGAACKRRSGPVPAISASHLRPANFRPTGGLSYRSKTPRQNSPASFPTVSQQKKRWSKSQPKTTDEELIGHEQVLSLVIIQVSCDPKIRNHKYRVHAQSLYLRFISKPKSSILYRHLSTFKDERSHENGAPAGRWPRKLQDSTESDTIQNRAMLRLLSLVL